MTSVLSSFGQIPTQSKNFVAVSTNSTPSSTSTNPSDPSISAFTVGPTALLPSDVTTDDTITGLPSYATAQVSMGTLYRDLGRKIIIAVPNLLGAASATHIAIYRQMQVIAGPASEGNPGIDSDNIYPTVYVKVWQAADSKPDNSICVARIG